MMKAIRRKLSSKLGDSIGEVLVALLISSLALMMLASMITSSTHLILNSKDKLESYYQQNNKLSSRTGTTTASSATIKFEGEAGGYQVNITCYTNDKIGGKEVISYEVMP